MDFINDARQNLEMDDIEILKILLEKNLWEDHKEDDLVLKY